MKRIVTITVSGDVPDAVAFVHVIADVLEHHARDLRSENSPVGNMARGHIWMETDHDGEFFRVDWDATYEPETAHNQGEPGTMKQIPTTGCTVLYRLSKRDADQTNKRRADAQMHRQDNTSDHPGWQAHIGNLANAGDVVPLTVVIVWPQPAGDEVDSVNGQAILDGNDSLWVTSAKEGHLNGQWYWPVMEPAEGR